MVKQIKYFILIVFLSTMHFETSGNPGPWFTGPLINTGLILVEKDQFTTFNIFNNNQLIPYQIWGITTQNVYGLTDKISFQIIPDYLHQARGTERHNGWGDLELILAYLFHRQDSGLYWPTIKLNFGEVLPIGHYDKLNPQADGVDGFGAGAHQTEIGFNTQYLAMLESDHYLMTSFNAVYGYTHSSHVKGANIFNGGIGTNGTVSSSNQFRSNLAFELQLTQNWVAGFEFLYVFSSLGTFTGEEGVKPDGSIPSPLRPRVNQWSISPEIEYNFNDHFGIVSGVWFSVNNNLINKFTNIQIAFIYSEKL